MKGIGKGGKGREDKYQGKEEQIKRREVNK